MEGMEEDTNMSFFTLCLSTFPHSKQFVQITVLNVCIVQYVHTVITITVNTLER